MISLAVLDFKPRLLLVDDDIQQRNEYKASLEQARFEVDDIQSAAEISGMLMNPYHAVLCLQHQSPQDINCPDRLSVAQPAAQNAGSRPSHLAILQQLKEKRLDIW